MKVLQFLKCINMKELILNMVHGFHAELQVYTKIFPEKNCN